MNSDDSAGADTRPSVVLVDDHEVVLEGLGRALDRGGLRIVGTFLSGEAALAHLDRHRVDLVVVDLRLAQQSGLSVLGAIRHLQPDAELAVLTSYEDPAAASAALRAGAKGFLLKDTRSTELSQRLCSVAQGNVVVDARVSAVLAGVSGHSAPQLSEQEIAILQAVGEGLTNREIGARMHLSHYTVKDYLTRTMRKLGTSRRAETVTKATQQGLLSDYGAE
jgi:DNA-binding NarL/FixJ family response regulator